MALPEGFDLERDYVVPQLSREEMAGMTPYKIMEAQREGRLAQVLGTPPAHANRLPSALDVLLPKPGEQWSRADLDLALERWQTNRIEQARARGDLSNLANGKAES